MELNTVDLIREAFYSLVNTDSTDQELQARGEATNERCDISLTRGCRKAQRFMLDKGYGGWRKRSSALSWTGTDATTGGRYATLPADFLKAYGNKRVSALRKANGDQWGMEIDAYNDFWKGNFYYFRGDEVWIGRTAVLPTTLYLEYHFLHPEWNDSVTIDFPIEARPLIVAEAANVAKNESWLPGDIELEAKIIRELTSARDEARDIARRSKALMEFKRPRRYGNRW